MVLTLAAKITYLERFHTQYWIARLVRDFGGIYVKVDTFPRYLRLIKEGKRSGKKYQAVITRFYKDARYILSRDIFLSAEEWKQWLLDRFNPENIDIIIPGIKPPFDWWHKPSLFLVKTFHLPIYRKPEPLYGCYFLIKYPRHRRWIKKFLKETGRESRYTLLARSIAGHPEFPLGYAYYFITIIFKDQLEIEFKDQDYVFDRFVGIDSRWKKT